VHTTAETVYFMPRTGWTLARGCVAATTVPVRLRYLSMPPSSTNDPASTVSTGANSAPRGRARLCTDTFSKVSAWWAPRAASKAGPTQCTRWLRVTVPDSTRPKAQKPLSPGVSFAT
jgi:hypothetical protein